MSPLQASDAQAGLAIVSQFNSWARAFNQTLKGEALKEAFANFKSNMKTIYEVNSDPTIPFVMTANEFTSMSYAQFKSTYLMSDEFSTPPPTVSSSSTAQRRRSLLQAPSALDWRALGMGELS